MRVLIQGAGLVGCATAVALAEDGHDVTVIDRRRSLATEGAGILLYWNAMNSLRHLGVQNRVLDEGVPMLGATPFLDSRSVPIGTVNYQSLIGGIPTYTGVERTTLLTILAEKAISLGANFIFDHTVKTLDLDESGVGVMLTNVVTNANDYTTFDLVVGADGHASSIRRYVTNVRAKSSAFGLWHAMLPRDLSIRDKLIAVAPGVRLGLIPLSDKHMYVWASRPELSDLYIDPQVYGREFMRRFGCFSGYIGRVVEMAVSENKFHFTVPSEVAPPGLWHKGRVVLLGDSVHASTPFMAQGFAQGLHDVISFRKLLAKDQPLEVSLTELANLRNPVVSLVQQMSHRIGESYVSPTVDVAKAQAGLDSFYTNPSNFWYTPL